MQVAGVWGTPAQHIEMRISSVVLTRLADDPGACSTLPRGGSATKYILPGALDSMTPDQVLSDPQGALSVLQTAYADPLSADALFAGEFPAIVYYHFAQRVAGDDACMTKFFYKILDLGGAVLSDDPVITYVVDQAHQLFGCLPFPKDVFNRYVAFAIPLSAAAAMYDEFDVVHGYCHTDVNQVFLDDVSVTMKHTPTSEDGVASGGKLATGDPIGCTNGCFGQ